MDSSVDDFLKGASKARPGKEIQLPIREFISMWGAKRRGLSFVKEINDDLAAFGLKTDPSFEEGWIDNSIRIVAAKESFDPTTADVDPTVSPDQRTLSATPNSPLKISSLRSSTASIFSVSRQGSLNEAQTIMLQHNLSQVAVLSGERDLLGAVSWESIAQKRMFRPEATLLECMVQADLVKLGDDLLSHVPKIVETGYVFVQAPDRKICGIVTMADLSTEFVSLAGPFLLLGEVERELRRIVDNSFTPEEIQAVVDPNDPARAPSKADELSFGEYVRLFEPKEQWAMRKWPMERVGFISALSDIRILRNEIMHFSPDPIELERVAQVRHMLKWLRLVDARPADEEIVTAGKTRPKPDQSK